MRIESLSLTARVALSAILALVVFLSLTGYALERAFYDSAVRAMQDRLRSHIHAYLSGSDVSVAGQLILPEVAPDPRLDIPHSGVYAAVEGGDNRWRSPSAIGLSLPFDAKLQRNEERFIGPVDTESGPMYVESMGIVWEVPNGKPLPLTFHVAEDDIHLRGQLQVFRRTLWIWLTIAAVLVVAVLLTALRWSLTPLRRVERDVARIERGTMEQLADDYPTELRTLTHSINDFIDGEREQRVRNRHRMGDLAHSLKTPLAVIRNALENPSDSGALEQIVSDQVRRMDDIVAYQLSRAGTAGHTTFSAPVSVSGVAEELVGSLEKVHLARGILCEFELAPEACFFGDRGDLMEILGNVLDNAFKWARHRVLLSTRVVPGRRRDGIEVQVEDDGAGIDDAEIERILQRGVRGDERVEGHGLGLAIVDNLIRDYRGELQVTTSTALGGACFQLRFPALN